MDAQVASSEGTNSKGNGHDPAGLGSAGALMTKAEEYRHHAVACIKQSETVTKSDEKALWLKVAAELDRMATAADRNPAAFSSQGSILSPSLRNRPAPQGGR